MFLIIPNCFYSRYNVLFLVLTYGIPILIMIYVYTAMGKELWGSRSIGEHTERQLESMKSKKKVNMIEMVDVSDGLFVLNNNMLLYFVLFISGSSNVHYHCDNICHLLATVPPILRGCLSQSKIDSERVRSTTVSGILLVSNVKRYGKSTYLLLDE